MSSYLAELSGMTDTR